MALSAFKAAVVLIIFFEFCNSLETIVVDYPGDSQESLWSEFPSPELLTIFNASVEWHKCNFSSILFCISQHPNSSLLLDYSKDLIVQNSLSQICQDYFLIHLVFQNNFRYLEKWSYSLTSSFSDYLSAFLSLLRYFNWSQGTVFLNEDTKYFKDEILQYLSELDYYTVSTMTDTNGLIDGVIARTGATIYYLFLNTLQSKNMQIALKNAKLLTSGSAVILNQESGYECDTEGVLIIAEKGHEFDASSQEYLKSTIIEIISLVLEAENSKDVKTFFDSKLPKHYASPEFSIINIQNGQRVIVGSITNGNLVISGNITFLGTQVLYLNLTKKCYQ
ncbi:unnamed protein product [Blepharisma stoltei]|uniref:Receptor ligand binding region domain-containing protein n=1 Tax=Blepharisma stoltei TaxID=1481888 RepID=A0AAU9ISL3_9CILI|nr:unnamed protein product [Blepharisma stoltei]